MKVVLNFLSDPGDLAAVRKGVRLFLEGTPLDEMQAELIVLALDEACTNVIRYAYENCPDRLIELTLELSANALICILRDAGTPCDPEKIKGRKLEDFRPGGLGVRIMETAFDRVEYTPCDTGTRLTLTKFFAPSHRRDA